MFTPIELKLLNMNLSSFPLMAAASATVKGCPTCPHKNVNKRAVLRTAALRLEQSVAFKEFLKKHFGLPVMIGGVLFKEDK